MINDVIFQSRLCLIDGLPSYSFALRGKTFTISSLALLTHLSHVATVKSIVGIALDFF